MVRHHAIRAFLEGRFQEHYFIFSRPSLALTVNAALPTSPQVMHLWLNLICADSDVHCTVTSYVCNSFIIISVVHACTWAASWRTKSFCLCNIFYAQQSTVVRMMPSMHIGSAAHPILDPMSCRFLHHTCQKNDACALCTMQ